MRMKDKSTNLSDLVEDFASKKLEKKAGKTILQVKFFTKHQCYTHTKTVINRRKYDK